MYCAGKKTFKKKSHVWIPQRPVGEAHSENICVECSNDDDDDERMCFNVA